MQPLHFDTRQLFLLVTLINTPKYYDLKLVARTRMHAHRT